MGHAFGPVLAGIDNYIENIVRFATVGTHTWTVPATIQLVDVFIVGGGGSGSIGGGYYKGGGGSGYTKAFRGSGYIKPTNGTTWETLPDGGRDGNAIAVTPGETIQIIVGDGGVNGNGGFSQFKNASYRAEGGGKGGARINGKHHSGGDGGSGGGNGVAGSDGSDGTSPNQGYGQGHTTRDFGELTGKRNAGGGSGEYTGAPGAGVSDYTEGAGSSPRGHGGGGYGGGAGAGSDSNGGKGGSGCVLIRYYTRK